MRRFTGSAVWAILGILNGVDAESVRATSTLTAVVLPQTVVADGSTETAILCSIAGGYPNNVYAIKGTFSDGDLPYFGLTYNPATTVWQEQEDSWKTAQARIQTDVSGAWAGYLYMRLEAAAPRGSVVWRLAAEPLSPISLPGPTVGAWQTILSLTATEDGNAGWLCGHVFRDKTCTQPADGIVVRALDASGNVLATYLSQNSRIADGHDHADLGAFRLGVPRGSVSMLSGRTRAAEPGIPLNSAVPLYTKKPGPWIIERGRATSVDPLPWGDVGGDGQFDAGDLLLALRLCAGTYRSAVASVRADVWPLAPDGHVTLPDVVYLARKLSGLAP